jgi:hypothetical protein
MSQIADSLTGDEVTSRLRDSASRNFGTASRLRDVSSHLLQRGDYESVALIGSGLKRFPFDCRLSYARLKARRE